LKTGEELMKYRADRRSRIKRLENACHSERLRSCRAITINHQLQQQCLRWKLNNLKLLKLAKDFRGELDVAHELLETADATIEAQAHPSFRKTMSAGSRTCQLFRNLSDIMDNCGDMNTTTCTSAVLDANDISQDFSTMHF
uniref:DUF630 domain-containing protein n=1 Tax=Anisakis simplex TaxID=6269 RepID=A0A0M3KI98_ANISI